MKVSLVLLGLLAALLLASLGVGYASLSVLDIWRGLLGQGDTATVVIAQDFRLPRTLLAALVGGALGLCGAALQGLLRNPLAEPGNIGVTSGAALGAVVMLYFGLAAATPWALPLGAILGAGAVVLLIFLLAATDGDTTALILAGVAISSIAMALTALAMNLSPNPWALGEIVYWLMGSVRDRSMADVGLALPFVLAGTALVLTTARGLDALVLGEGAAQSMGVDLRSVRIRIILGTALAVGGAVAVAGAIGFVGLIVPHVLRPFTGYVPSKLLLPSAIGGAILLLAADVCVRLLTQITGAELYLGVFTALIGGPFFIYLVFRIRRGLL